MFMKNICRVLVLTSIMCVSTVAQAQKYKGVIDKTIAVIGNEMITISDLEEEVKMMRAQGMMSDRNVRCEILESMMENKLLLMQARIDSLEVNADMVDGELANRLDQVRTSLGGDDGVEAYFKKPVYKLRQEWRTAFQEQSLIQQEQQEVIKAVPDMTPFDVKSYLDTVDVDDLPVVPIKYQLSQICVYPDRDAANTAVKEKLISLRERILNGEKFSTLARLYSEDPGSASRGGELGMASKSLFWPAFSDAAMSLKPGLISQIVETPDGFHIIEVLDKKGDMFNARHILIKPKYTVEDQEKAFALLDSIKTEINNKAITFDLAARFYSQDDATRTNGGQMADPHTGSSYFEIDQLKPQDFTAVQDLEEGQISAPIASLDNEGRDGNLVFKIIRLDKVLDSHPATFEHDFTMISDQVKSIKQQEVLRDFVGKKILETKISIDPLFQDCPFSRSEWSTKF